jgi:membrane-bound metal-dependent hydrolase YbcI (DUF457 family)
MGKTTSKFLDVKMNVPLLFLASILPDVDFVLGLQHRGPTHSVIVYSLVFVAAFFVFGKQAVPVLVSLVQHSLLGDLLTAGGVQVLWPVVSDWYGVQMPILNVSNVIVEWAVFISAMALLLRTKDVMALFQSHPYNLVLTVPVFAIVLPAFLSYPITIPVALMIPHLVLLALLVFSMVIDVKQILRFLH